MSVSEQKTHAEIVAEMRNRAKRPDFVSQDVLKSCADELDAAHKREMVELRKQVGNAAKLREALSDACYAMFNFLKAQYGGYEEMANALDKAKSALAAPPRNCDRFDSSTQARAEWYKTEVLPRVEGVVSGVEPPFVDWLFAPATEKEGGAK